MRISLTMGAAAFLALAAVAFPVTHLVGSAFAAGDGGGGSSGGGSSGGNSGGGSSSGGSSGSGSGGNSGGESSGDSGGNSAGSSSRGRTDSAATRCRKGLVLDLRRNKCVAPQQGAVDDESIYRTGRDLADADRFDEAIAILSLAENKSDPRVLNYLGYSHRKLGRINVGLGYYQEALRIDPDYTLVREYLGEAYLQLGDVHSAKLQLAEIERLCGGTECREYALLAEEIGRHTATRTQ